MTSSSCWVSRKTIDQNGKASFAECASGLKGVKPADRFAVFYRDGGGKQKQEMIKAQGRSGKRLADLRAEQLRAQLTLGVATQTSRTTWSDFRKKLEAEEFYAKRRVTREGYCKTLDIFESICKPSLLADVSPATLATFAMELSQRQNNRGKPIAKSSINRHLRVLRLAMRRAHRWRMVDELCPVDLLKVSDADMVRATHSIPDADLQKIWNACDLMTVPKLESDSPYTTGDFWRALIALAVTAGLRRAELLDLRWDDVQLDKGVLVFDAAGNKAGRRDVVPLPESTVRHLRKIVDFHDLVFGAWPLVASRLTEHFHELERLAGLTTIYQLHDLRRTCATRNAATMTPQELQAFMRHTTTETTMKYYVSRVQLAEGARSKVVEPDCLK